MIELESRLVPLISQGSERTSSNDNSNSSVAQTFTWAR
jgi:hypothetical protein